MVGDEVLLARGRWAAIVPQAIRSLLWTIVVGALSALVNGAAGDAVVAALVLLVLFLATDTYRWWQLRDVGYSVVDGALVVSGRRWSQTYPLADIERAEVVGAATWGRAGLNLLLSLSPPYPLVRLQVRGQPVWGPRVAVWGVEGAAALQRALDSALATRQPA